MSMCLSGTRDDGGTKTFIGFRLLTKKAAVNSHNVSI